MKKIMFNDRFGLTQAVLEGRKTMTRRAICVPERWHGIEVYGFSHIKGETALQLLDGDDFCIEDTRTGQMGQILSTYKIGEVVAIAQAYKDLRFVVPHGADPQEYNRRFTRCCDSAGWKNKMYVRADLMPHQIRITNIRIERIQEISEDDCLREGIRMLTSESNPTHYTFDGWRFKNKVFGCSDTPREAFAALIKKLSARKAWDNNPYVFVYEFELVK